MNTFVYLSIGCIVPGRCNQRHVFPGTRYYSGGRPCFGPIADPLQRAGLRLCCVVFGRHVCLCDGSRVDHVKTAIYMELAAFVRGLLRG